MPTMSHPVLRHRQRLWFAIPLVLCWLSSTAYAFWWFEARDLRAFDTIPVDQAAFATPGTRVSLPALASAGDSSAPLVLHFWNPACSCNRFNNPHVRDIVATYRAQGVRFLTVVRAAPGADTPALLAQAREIFNTPALLESALPLDPDTLPPATPAAAIINAQGQLDYSGPYSDSAFCGAAGEAAGSTLVENALERILAGQTPQASERVAFGCFCAAQQA